MSSIRCSNVVGRNCLVLLFSSAINASINKMNPIFASVLVAFVGMFLVNKQRNVIKEHFMPPLGYKRELDVTMSYTPPRDMTSNLSPRIGNVSYGSNINYRPPEEKLLAVEPFNPLGVSNDGEIQPVIYDRFIYANKKSRLYSQGDSIRGDLPIIPAQGNWFVPSVTPHIDLRDGALNVMGGQFNETSSDLSSMKYNLTLGVDNIHAGLPYQPPSNMIPVKQTSGMIPLYQEIMNRIGDVQINSFMP